MPSSRQPRQAGTTVTPQEALDFHARGRPGKLEITPTKPMATQRDLSLAYSPGVAVPLCHCERFSGRISGPVLATKAALPD